MPQTAIPEPSIMRSYVDRESRSDATIPMANIGNGRRKVRAASDLRPYSISAASSSAVSIAAVTGRILTKLCNSRFLRASCFLKSLCALRAGRQAVHPLPCQDLMAEMVPIDLRATIQSRRGRTEVRLTPRRSRHLFVARSTGALSRQSNGTVDRCELLAPHCAARFPRRG